MAAPVLMLGSLAGLSLLAAATVGAGALLRRGLAPAATLPSRSPADIGLPMREARIATRKGLQLFAWYLPPVANDGAPAPAIVLLHGWGGNAGDLLPAAEALHRAGFAVLLPEARNHGRSERDGASSLPRFAEDLEHALDWLAAQPGVDAGRLAALGHSVGAAAVLLVASRRSELRAAISLSAFADPEQVMRRWLRERGVPYRPLGWLVNRYVEHVIGARFRDIAPIGRLALARCPVLLVHGRQDRTVPLDDARELWRRRGQAEVRLLECEGSHEAFDDVDALGREVLGFLRQLPPFQSPARLSPETA